MIEGLADMAAEEIGRLPGTTQVQAGFPRADHVRFAYDGDPRVMLNLKTVQAVYLLRTFDVPRPKALLGDQNFKLVSGDIQRIQTLHPPGTFKTLAIAAAGSESSVMQRLKTEWSQAAGLIPADDKGDLMLRIRPGVNGAGWECLARLSPRPLATRDWRVRNYEAALNATVAHAMALLTQPHDDDTFVNLCSGSGSLLIERAAAAPAVALLGTDNDRAVCDIAWENISAAHMQRRIALCLADAIRLPLPDACATALAADLPFGQRVGSHTDNARFYPAILSEAARITRPGALFALLTHEIRLMERLLVIQNAWLLRHERRITLRGLHPRIYLLERTQSSLVASGDEP